MNHPTSRITFEVWLPTTQGNKRFVQVGNGGFAGVIEYDAMATRLRQGYAAASTDDGTTPAPGVPPAQMLTFLGDLQRLYDFKGRAVTLTAGVAKALYQLYYRSPPVYSYFTGFSSGGLEALAVVQRIGDQFDGVSAGCPANNSAGLFTQALWTYKYYQKVSTKLTLIHNAALAACDTLGDGINDGLISNPEQCRFNPRQLACKGGDRPDCLTDEQVDAVQKIYEGPVDPKTGLKTGEQYAPGMPPGSELVWPTSLNQAQGASEPWYGMLLYGSLTFDIANFNFGSDVERALDITRPYGAQVTNPDISTFRDKGGKLLMWAGWSDPLWSQMNIVKYYKQVVAADNGRPAPYWSHHQRLGRGAYGNTQRFARLFMAPGMGHCGGGDGPNVVDTFTPLVDWVEHGNPPEQIVATQYANNDPTQPVVRTRPLCPYPAVARWKGAGSPNSADNFMCVTDVNSGREQGEGR